MTGSLPAAVADCGDDLSSRWGAYRAKGGGKVVWAVIGW